MKQMRLIATFLALTAFAVGCKPSEEESTSRQIKRATQDTREAAQEMKDYPYAQKADFVTHTQNQLAEVDQELDQLSAIVEKSSDAAKAEVKPKLQALREQVADLNRRLDDLKNASESTWGDVVAGFTEGFHELKDGANEARQWVSDKIAP